MEIQSFALTPFMTNCFVVSDGDEAIVIDPGDAAPVLTATLAKFKVKAIINTHCHCDHCGGNAEVKRLTNAPLLCHRDEVPLLRALKEQGMMFGVHFPASPDPDGYVAEGDTVTVGTQTFEVRDAPGHSPGHIVLVGNGVVFGGDVLFAGSIGRTDLWGGDFETLIRAIRTKLLTLPDNTIVYSGHGPETTIGEERRSNPFLLGA